MIVAVFYATRKRVVIIKHTRLAVANLFKKTFEKGEVASVRFTELPLSNAIDCASDPTTVSNIMCDLCDGADRVEVTDNFAGTRFESELFLRPVAWTGF